MLAGLLRAAWRDRIGQQAAAKVSERIGIHAATWEEPHEIPKSLDLYHAKQLAKSKVAGENLLTSFQISCMDNFVVGGVWPQTHLHEAGYEVDVRCQLCLEAEDTLDHRLFCCRYSCDARAQLVWEEGGGSLAEARAHPLASRGLAGDPARGPKATKTISTQSWTSPMPSARRPTSSPMEAVPNLGILNSGERAGRWWQPTMRVSTQRPA